MRREGGRFGGDFGGGGWLAWEEGKLRALKALVLFWIIDETLVLTSIVCVDLMRLVHAK